MANDNFGS